MEAVLISPANISVLGLPGWLISTLIPAVGIGVFLYIVAKRLIPMAKANSDPRTDRVGRRIWDVIKIWLIQFKQPRYMTAGVLHILIFAGFIILSVRSVSLVFVGIQEGFTLPGMHGLTGDIYSVLKDYAATVVLIACVVAGVRRGVFTPERYRVPPKYGHDHTGEAVFVLGLIGALMVFESLFGASHVVAQDRFNLPAEAVAPGSLAWLFSVLFAGASIPVLQGVHSWSYYLHDLVFFFFLCYLPFGKHFHVITSIFNVFFHKLDRGTIKPVRWGVPEGELDKLETFGVKYFEDFTWKHMLDFYTCADCGRCSDNCPATTVGRPLSPRFISIKSRDYAFDRFPVLGEAKTREPVMGKVFEEDEIWSCTTCGACEEECPAMIEYIDKVVDLRRAMVEDGNVPQSLQKPLGSLEKRGNPYGKMEKRRADWTKELPEGVEVKLLEGGDTADTLFFLDSATSYDERLQEIARATASVLHAAGEDFGILGKSEKDSGHEVRRFGEEMLFQDLKEHNTEAIAESGTRRIVTGDPHAYNALVHDYSGLPPAEHISQLLLRHIRSGRLKLHPVENGSRVYAYHDPCYLGRHNLLYEEPRQVLDSIPGLQRVEMARCRDSSFCCGGGGLMLYYEPPAEDRRMGQVRAEMAAQAGADVIVTACPFCLINLEDGIKTSGLEGKIEAVDLTELVLNHLDQDRPEPGMTGVGS
jgi:Fe-S oxidoreductase